MSLNTLFLFFNSFIISWLKRFLDGYNFYNFEVFFDLVIQQSQSQFFHKVFYCMQQQILLVKLNSIELSLDDNGLFSKKHSNIFVSPRKIPWKGPILICLLLDIILIKSALSPSSPFIYDFDISCWRFCISDFNIWSSIQWLNSYFRGNKRKRNSSFWF